MDAVSLRARIGYAPQDIYMFSGTIAENIAPRKPSASLEEVMEAAKKAGADEFINKLTERTTRKSASVAPRCLAGKSSAWLWRGLCRGISIL
ncbi:MAG: hypothetical protein LBF60_04630 [Treponema sp.]|jgi:ABC-type multidrug transport system fused ATPase/permease subunit|nr:hypothetical protein [Treponema sp.]